MNIKVRANPGATVGDMHHHLTALLRKKPTYVVIHAGTNDSVNEEKSSGDIFNEIVELKKFVEVQVPGVKVTISCPIVRRDNNKANVKVIHIRAMLRTSGLHVITNDSIGYKLLGRKGLHLSEKGVGRFALNLIGYLKRL